MRRLAGLLGAALVLSGARCPPKPDPRIDRGEIFEVQGGLEGVTSPETKVLVAAYSDFPGRKGVEGAGLAHGLGGARGAYGIVVGPGDYDLLGFADLDGDGVFRDEELVGRSRLEQTVGLSTAPDGYTVAVGSPIALDFTAVRSAGIGFRWPAPPAVFESLEDPFFDGRWGRDGLLWPTRLLAHTSSQMLFGVGEHEPSKVQVLFVHGVTGTPRDFRVLVENLDQSRYQPWFVFYPSGLPLAKMGAKVAGLVRMLAEQSPVILVAHSMGGLVCRSALNHLQYPSPRALPENLKGYVSFSAMYGGMENAKNLYLLAPYDSELPRSLLDVPPQSDFMRDVYSVPYPEGLAFHLFWGNVTGDGDGTIPKASQLYWPMAAHATLLHEYRVDHTGILGEAVVVDFRVTLGNLAVR